MSGLLLTMTLGALTACGGGGGGGGGRTPASAGTTQLDTLSGIVRSSGGEPLANVTVSVGTASARTNGRGAFILSSLGALPVGTVHVEIDGSTAQASGPLAFPALEIVVPLLAGTSALTLPNVVTLPDLNNIASANQNVALNADGSSNVAIDVLQVGGLTDIGLSGPAGTVITLNGVAGAVDVDLNVTPVIPSEVPMPLPDGLIGNSFVTIQPANAAFDPPGAAQGIDIVLPDNLDLVPGTKVDIWSFDHEAGEWLNRSEETGGQGLVQLVGGTGPGTEVVAKGVITEGGWHTAVVTVDPSCATTLEGSVIDKLTGLGIAGASVIFESGQFTSTAADGTFSLGPLVAYDVALLAGTGVCAPISVGYEIVLPPCAGGLSSGRLTLFDTDVVTGGTTTLGPAEFALSNTGSVAGVVLGMGAPGALVTLTPDMGTPFDLLPAADGAFFSTGLPAGAWMAEFLFAGQTNPTTVAFTVQANQITTVAIQFAQGSGGGETITVLVLEDRDSELIASAPLPPVAGASVRLQGSDAISSGGLVMLTDASGRATFNNVTGPFTVTAQKDLLRQTQIVRFASSVVGISPASGTIGMFLTVGFTPPILGLDATLTGTVANLPPFGLSEFVELRVASSTLSGVGFFSGTVVNPDGSFSLAVPANTPLHVMAIQRDFAANSSVLSTLIAPGIGQASSGGSINLNLDYANAAAWDRPVNFDLTNAVVGGSLALQMSIENEALGFLAFLDFHHNIASAQDTIVNLPDFNHASFAGLEVSLEAEVLDPIEDSRTQDCELLVSGNAPTLVFDFLGLPSLNSPFNEQELTLAELGALSFAVVEGSPNFQASNGLNFVSLSYGPSLTGAPPVGINAMSWEIAFRPGTTNFGIPLTALPMFGDGLMVDTEIGNLRFSGLNFDFDSFFSESLDANLKALLDSETGNCESYVEGTFSIE